MEQLLPFPTAGDLISKKVKKIVSVPSDTTLLAAVQLMTLEDIGFLLVIDDATLVGALSERDCARHVLVRELSPVSTTVHTIMTRHVHSVSLLTKLPECVMLMHDANIRHLPVTSGRDVVGVLSVRDVMGALVERYDRLMRRFSEERLSILYPDPSSY
jgi:CBS domain-containing protein